MRLPLSREALLTVKTHEWMLDRFTGVTRLRKSGQFVAREPLIKREQLVSLRQ
jgi:hypothetical protein